ncbi:hypothetical protein QBC37DRAFT_33966 [Rhypophila decipiens]|uniref:Uncharacterized protein n=1 Tax=Rhypophila decipiens TaxID=261697 RepID=A0AAN6YJK1_9PEZI|nr:hypothetical protein QBC37DRAFT_33966 [Rhypophila decipiens]
MKRIKHDRRKKPACTRYEIGWMLWPTLMKGILNGTYRRPESRFQEPDRQTGSTGLLFSGLYSSLQNPCCCCFQLLHPARTHGTCWTSFFVVLVGLFGAWQEEFFLLFFPFLFPYHMEFCNVSLFFFLSLFIACFRVGGGYLLFFAPFPVLFLLLLRSQVFPDLLRLNNLPILSQVLQVPRVPNLSICIVFLSLLFLLIERSVNTKQERKRGIQVTRNRKLQ